MHYVWIIWHIKWMITLTLITLSGFHCISFGYRSLQATCRQSKAFSGFTLSVFEGGEAGPERAGGDQQNDKSKHVEWWSKMTCTIFRFWLSWWKVCVCFFILNDAICLARLEMNWHVCGMSVLFDLNYSKRCLMWSLTML